MKLAALTLAALAAVALAGCEREARRLTSSVSNSAPGENAPRMSTNQPGVALTGGVKQAAENTSPYKDNAFAVSNGKRLYRWYNCNGCHASGGGGIGPPLMDAEWKYGSDPKNIFTSIMQGRPNGMPSFGGHIAEDQAWQIVAYVQSMSGGVRKDVATSRADSLYPGLPENARPEQPARPEGKAQ
jgi:cytochrome c oxidase cbb3-type subunit 3